METKLKTPNNVVSTGLLTILLLFITLPKAGMIDWAAFTLNMLVMAALTFYVIGNSLEYQDRPWLIVFCALTGWILVQWFIIPRFIGWNLYLPSSITPPKLEPRVINISESIHYWAMFCAYWALAFIVSKQNHEQLITLLWALCISFIFQVLYGIIAYFTESNSYIGLWQKTYYLGSATGTFVNHNHYGGFLAMCWPIFISFFMLKKQHGGMKTPGTIRWLILLFISLLCLIALLTSSSRMGLVVAIAGITLWAWRFSSHELQLSHKWRIGLLLAMWLGLLCIGLWFGLGEIIARFERLWIVETRWEIWFIAFRLPVEAWIWGVGAGNFADAYTLVQPPVAIKTAQEAHNDYLQFILEFGIIGSFLILGTIVYWIYKCLPQQPFSLIRWGALCGLIAISLHSLVDFNLQIPGTAVYFWFGVGCVMNANIATSKHHQV